MATAVPPISSPLPGRPGSHSATPRELSPLARKIAEEPIAKAVSPVVLTGAARFVEFVLIVLTGAAVHAVWISPTQGFEPIYLMVELAVAAAAIIAFQMVDIYNVQAFRSHVYQLGRLGLAWTAVFLLALAVSFFAKYEYSFSRAWTAGWYVTGMAVLFAWRLGLAWLVRHWADQGRLIRRVVVVGGGREGEALVRAIGAEAHSDLRICGVFDDRSDDRSPSVVAGVPKLGTVDDLVEFTRRTRVDLILVSLPLTAEERVLQMARKLWVLPVDVRLAAHMNRLRFRPRAYSYIGNIPVLDIFDKPIADWNLVIKSVFDRVAAFLILLAISPVMIATALAIKLDSRGPVFFRQRRLGFNNEVIEVFKFRSLYHEHSDPDAKRVVTKGDNRVTKVGRFIRKTSIDELPQLLNVLRGDLSLVGPRPHAIHAPLASKLWDDAVDGYFARHRVKPGITGWAQINGWRGELDTPEKLQQRVEHDLYYIENWSLLFDLYILLRTPFALLKTENAY
ncbi:undecaprenyl-phosphate glucose phosphotransferase [Rhodoplanes sp. TEM]|uniref:Undecaprenyl-phosphate glucose phosphotransferase n=1 Tax=Rhodoplanes tepidamans TaxID=200616 RepID=A0ABT5JI98_RHOTP|nr:MULTISPECIES: undecaprenyl-phosphate glucose phosphotransferase [Rhodoplanes]MDC7789450.1 undecaprenyl-phosphate glucose phosphotransferase [Rhodoplanes tepidamans]MDC7985413.1 undecaprenyl-phosphate glucose phosphotransferase [Rhodoplanes sp. TEM]MDQ0353625.1 Undecaprenyl-phosphate glucose phosphotransferase [Rhodoplanes tepidamans]